MQRNFILVVLGMCLCVSIVSIVIYLSLKPSRSISAERALVAKKVADTYDVGLLAKCDPKYAIILHEGAFSARSYDRMLLVAEVNNTQFESLKYYFESINKPLFHGDINPDKVLQSKIKWWNPHIFKSGYKIILPAYESKGKGELVGYFVSTSSNYICYLNGVLY